MTLNLEAKLERGEATNTEVVNHLLTHFYADVLRLAQGVLRDRDAAEDVAQKTMIQAANKIDSYTAGTNMRAWVLKIGVNLARSQLRKRKTRERLTLGLIKGWDQRVAESAETHLIQSQRDRDLWQAVSKLSDKQRLPIILHYSFELTTREIGEILNIPQGTVLSRLYHAHRKLRGMLEINR